MKNMKRMFVYGLLLIPLILSAGCPQLELDGSGARAGESVRPELEVWQLLPEGDIELRVLDIDPDEIATVYIKDSSLNMVTTGSFQSSSNAVSVRADGVNFLVSGMAGAMGMVTFTNTAKTKSATLYVFVRNWKASDVYRHTLAPDPVNYRFVPERDESIVVNRANNASQPIAWQDNSYSIYMLIVQQGFHYEAPDGNSSRLGRDLNPSTVIHRDTLRESWMREQHNRPHILYYPQGEYPLGERTAEWVAQWANDYRSQADWKEDFLRKPVFKFEMHYEDDGDMVGGYADRQRLELKTMDNSYPPVNEGTGDVMFSNGGGDIFTHRWKFKLPADFLVSTEYTHIHQLKPEGADNGNPTITLTARKMSSGQEVMQLIYRGPIREVIGDREIPSANWYPQQVPLEPFKGEWIRVEETVTYDSPGTYRIKVVRIRDLRVLMEWEYNPAVYDEEDPFVMFRKGNTYIRQKNGLYRRIMHMTPFGLPNPDDMVLEYLQEHNETNILFTDFEMDKWKK